jgi:UDP:flavonoid glycosyltransferase YjiC (YdhE family)
VLATVLDALRPVGLRVAVATGSSTGLPDVPSSWLLRPFLPQVALLERSALLVTHGGNNSVTEALTAGVPMVLLPFSTDQFAGAAAIEACGLGTALDPSTATSADVASAARSVLDGHAVKLARTISEGLRRAPGRDVARAALRG